MTQKAYASLYFLYEAAKRFATLDRAAAQKLAHALARALQTGAHQAAHELIQKIPTTDLWLGAVAEPKGITIISLMDREPDEALRGKIRAIMRATKRPTLGGVSVETPVEDVQETVRALLQEIVLVDHGGIKHHAHTHEGLVRDLTRSARRWRTTQARRDFKEILQEASLAPQVVERDGQEVFIIDRDLLERFEQPLTGAALAARFAKNRLPRLVFRKDQETEPEPDVRLIEDPGVSPSIADAEADDADLQQPLGAGC